MFYRITQPEKTVYRIRDVDDAIATTVAGIVRSEIGKMELDEVQSNRNDLIEKFAPLSPRWWMIGGSKSPAPKFLM